MRKIFEEELIRLKDEILLLGSMVEKAILNAVDSLKKRDREAARLVLELDREINARRFAIEAQVTVVIATQQPMAYDLRLLASILEVAGELERMGDYAKGIAKINIRMGDQPNLKPLVDIPEMARLAVDMLRRALTAFVRGDGEAASLIPLEDDRVDELFIQVYNDLMIFVNQDAKAIERANWLLWVAHNLERVADRVTNICERTLYVVTGQMREIDSSDDEERKMEEIAKPARRKVLFLCTGNSCRSQMAEAIVNHLPGQGWEAQSAGTRPAGYVHPMALKALAEIGIQHLGRSKGLDEFRGVDFDLVVTVCDDAAEDCPAWFGQGRRVHLGFVDPGAAPGSDEERMEAFRRVRDEMRVRVVEMLKGYEG